MSGPVLFESEGSYELDNTEGLAVHRQDGATILSLISDDNFSSFQRTVLVEFALVDQGR